MLKRILFVIDTLLEPRGTELHLFELARRLPAFGVEPIVCNLGGDEPVAQAMAAEGIEVWSRKVERLYAPAGLRTIAGIARQARARGVAAVHTFHFKSDWAGSILAPLLRVPHVSSRRDLGFGHGPLQRAVYRAIDPRVTRFIAPSNAVRQMLARRPGVVADRIEVVPNGVDLQRFRPDPSARNEVRAELAIPVDAPVVGMVASLRSIKDQPTLLRAIRVVADRRPEVRCVLAGSGPCEASLRQLVRDLRLDEQVRFAGNREDVPRILSALDAFVLSTLSEGHSNAILEAMASGLPVVATDAGGNRESVVEGMTGYVVPIGDASTMADRIHRLLGDPAHARALGDAGRKRAESIASLDGMVAQTAAVHGVRTVPGRRRVA